MRQYPSTRTRSFTRTLLFVLLSAFALIAAACGSGGVEAADSTAESTSTPEEDGTVGTTSDEGADDYESPLMDALGVDFSSFENVDYEQVEQDRQFEIQKCMQDLGFEYTPETVDFGEDFASVGPAPDADVEWGTEEFAKKFGYGISTFIEDEIAMFSSYDESSSTDQYVDPNSDYVQSLPEAAQEAYREALYGTQPDVFETIDPVSGMPINPDTGETFTDEEINEALNDFEPSGCQYTGQDNVMGGGEEGELLAAFDEEFGEFYQDFFERVQADPRVANLNDEWVRCMADKSYTFASRDETYEAVQSEMEPLYEKIYNFGGAPAEIAIDDETLNNMSEEEIEDYFASFEPSAPEITPELQAEIDRISEFEIALATADFACADGTDETMQQVQLEYEQRFLEENQAAITAFLEKQKAASDG